tara:strand:- start:1179 stop:1352 length:174 start_codon:yes stop_codon:yes gene_type:complete
MKRTDRTELNLNKSSSTCAPCLNEASKIERQINKKSLGEIKIEEIKKVVGSIFDGKK